jgi:hypothetical protein
MVCDCGYAFNAQGTAWVQKEYNSRGVPDLRGPGVIAKIGACLVGYICGVTPLAMIGAFLQVSGRPVGLSFRTATMGAGIFGAVTALRMLKRAHQRIRR